MTEAIFPALPGLGWSVTKAPAFSTRLQTSISGRELRLLDHPDPIWEWKLTYSFLRDKNDTRGGTGRGTGFDELRQLAGFFLARRGSFESFLFNDPTDNLATDETIGVGDGSNVNFQLYRSFGPYQERMTAPIPASVVLKDNGVTVTSGTYVVSSLTGVVVFLSPPASGHTITATFSYYFRVRFSEDSAEFENFMYQLWELREIKLKSVLP